MALPKVALPTETLTIDGQEVPVRGLSRKEVLALSELKDTPEKADVLAVAWGCGVTEDEAAEWLDSSPSNVTIQVVGKVMELSGLGDVPND